MAEPGGNALISVFDKTGIVDFAGGIHELGWNIYGSGGTAKQIGEAGIPVTDIAELVGGKAILGHKVVTLSREVGAALLADLNDADEMAEMERNNLITIEMVVQDPYPLEEAIAKPDATPASVLAATDIGGPTLLREIAKGARILSELGTQGRIVLSVAEQRQMVLEWLQAGKPDEAEFIRLLAARAVYEVARYTGIEAQYWNGDEVSITVARKVADTKYGENPQQVKAALYADNRVNIDPLGLGEFKHVKGWELSYINETDIYRLRQTSARIAAGFERNFSEVPPMAVGVKHGNACGAGVAETHSEAVKKMLEGDTRAIFGGVIMINGEIDAEVARVLMTHMMDGEDNRLLDGVIGASVTDEALELLSRKKLRVVINPALGNLNEQSLDKNRQKRFVGDAVLEQDANMFVLDFAADHMDQYGDLTNQQKRDLVLAWGVGSTSNSNTITIAKEGMIIGNGVGQQDRVGAGQLALSRTTIELPEFEDEGDSLIMKVRLDKKKLEGAVAYSDSFFPFADGPSLLVRAGIKAFLATWNTEAHKEILKEIHELGASVAMMPDKIGRGFFGH